FTEGFAYADPTELGSVKKLADEHNCCAIMFEVVQGEGGVNTLSPEFIDEIKAVAKEKDLLILVDEVQTGNGRTGQLYGFMNVGIQPDIFTTAKGLGGGLPIGAVVFSEKTENALVPGTHGSTFGGNPVCAAGACNVMERIDEELLSGVRERSEYIINELKGAKGVKSVTGMGLMLGIDPEKPVADIVAACREKGVLVLTAKTKVRLLPPLNIPMEQLKKAVAVIKEVLA
ncbi:MAG: aminotransferase class III-fold pyridoxal phosphate-dependent enzyme, partial [Clostridia bacterium]|nr:aminotransferase class III-fold pyridoxal phosphate-dependent enzyme [Clostridia bacterium]